MGNHRIKFEQKDNPENSHEKQELSEQNYEKGDIPEGVVSSYDFENQEQRPSFGEVYQWYASAMKRRNREPLEEERFIRHFFEEGSFDTTYLYGKEDKGFILGFCKHGIFIPTHFAPKTLRGGYELFKELGTSTTIPVVGAITEDLVETLTKLPGWKTIKLSLLAYLNSDLVQKTVVYNSCPGIRKKMFKLVKEFVLETKRIREKENSSDEFDDYEPEDDFKEGTNNSD